MTVNPGKLAQMFSATTAETLAASPDRAEAIRRGRRIAYLSICCTTVEAGVGILAGARADSTALLGFGVDSVIEVFSAAVVLWRMQAGARGERRERTALRLIGASLLLLAVFIGVGAIRSLIGHEPAAQSYLGIALAVGSIVVMQWLARAKRSVARDLSSGAVQADSVQSEICSYLAAILLVGLGLNAWLGWWWADPLAALAMVPLVLKEGWSAWRGEACGCSHLHEADHI